MIRRQIDTSTYLYPKIRIEDHDNDLDTQILAILAWRNDDDFVAQLGEDLAFKRRLVALLDLVEARLAAGRSRNDTGVPA